MQALGNKTGEALEQLKSPGGYHLGMFRAICQINSLTNMNSLKLVKRKGDSVFLPKVAQ